MIPDQKLPPLGPKVGEKWFVLPSMDSNTVTLFEVEGIWSRVVGLRRLSSSAPEYFLTTAVRFVERRS